MCVRPEARASENISESVREGVGDGERSEERDGGGEPFSITKGMVLRVSIG